MLGGLLAREDPQLGAVEEGLSHFPRQLAGLQRVDLGASLAHAVEEIVNPHAVDKRGGIHPFFLHAPGGRATE